MNAKTMLLWVLLSLGAWAQSHLSLASLLASLRMRYPGAEVTGRFSDWRTLSRYRRQAGLHYGYDIALPPGSEVPAAWPGRVVAVTPWYGPQYGITVDCGGVEATYGHLIPLVKVGDSVLPGRAVGRTVIDHVDVKMRDGAGNYIDYGQGFSAGGGAESYKLAWKQEQSALIEVDRLAQAVRALEIQAGAPVPEGNWEELYAEGAVSRCQFEQVRRTSRNLTRRLSQARRRLTAARHALVQATRRREHLSAFVPESEQKISPLPRFTVPAAGPRPSFEVSQWLEEGVITREEAARLSRSLEEAK